MSKHTPGQWYLNDDETEDGTIDVLSKRRPYICTVHSGAIPGTTDANARLIAAAPDLLEALAECLECEFPVTDKAAIQKARAAIAKATGDGA